MPLRYLKNVTTLVLDADACIGCGLCIDVCPHEVFAMENHQARIVDQDACMECGACALNCECGALSVRSGVGCATAVIEGWRKGTEPTCSCGDDPACCN